MAQYARHDACQHEQKHGHSPSKQKSQQGVHSSRDSIGPVQAKQQQSVHDSSQGRNDCTHGTWRRVPTHGQNSYFLTKSMQDMLPHFLQSIGSAAKEPGGPAQNALNWAAVQHAGMHIWPPSTQHGSDAQQSPSVGLPSFWLG